MTETALMRDDELEITTLQLIIDIPLQEASLKNFTSTLAAFNSLYDIFTAIEFFPEAFTHEQSLSEFIPHAYYLSIWNICHDNTKSKLSISLRGVARVLSIFPRVIEIIRDWKPKREQAHHRAEQERQKAIRGQLENLKKVDGLKIPQDVKEKIYRSIVDFAIQIEESSYTLRVQ
jgi:hypothetical protein